MQMLPHSEIGDDVDESTLFEIGKNIKGYPFRERKIWWRTQSVIISESREYTKSTFWEGMENSICDYIEVERVYWVDPLRGDEELDLQLCLSRKSVMSQPS